MSRFSEYIRFKIATFPKARHARYLADTHKPVTTADVFDFYSDWLSSCDAGEIADSVADRLDNQMARYAAVVGARTAVGWYLANLGVWLIDHDLKTYLRIQSSDGHFYQMASEAISTIRAVRAFKNEKVGQAAGAEESGESAQATAGPSERDEAAPAV